MRTRFLQRALTHSTSPMRRDLLTREQRYRAMAANRGRTRPERALASALWRRGLRFLTDAGYRRRRGRSLVGHPDLVLSRQRVVIFVDGCFWHGCPRCGGIPSGVSAFWRHKIETNVCRDLRVTLQLRREGWRVIRVREHQIGSPRLLDATADRLALRLRPRARYSRRGQ